MPAPERSGVAVGGQVVVGDYAVRIHGEHGAAVSRAAQAVRLLTRPATATPDLGALIGRDRFLGAARGALQGGATVEVVGEPGIGKTAFLSRLGASGELGGVAFLRAAGQPSEDLAQLLFEHFYETDAASVATPAELEELLSDQRALVVLDDAAVARQELERLARLAPRCAFAIGAPERRFVGDERPVALDGLDEPACLALAERELARALTEQERMSLGRLSQALGGHPLRVVQAAHLMREGRRPRPGQATPTGSPRDQFDELIVQSLSGDEERLLSPLAALPGVALEGRRLAGITGVPDADTALAALEARGLTCRHGSGYRLVETAVAPLERRVDGADWRARAVEHYAGAANLRAEEAPALLALLGVGAGGSAVALRLARNADAPLALGSRWGAWRELLELALREAREFGDRRTEAWALHQLGSRAGCLGDVQGAAEFLQGAGRLREQLGDDEAAALTRENLKAFGVDPPAPTPPPAPVPPPAVVTPPPATPPAPVPPPAVVTPPPATPPAVVTPPPAVALPPLPVVSPPESKPAEPAPEPLPAPPAPPPPEPAPPPPTQHQQPLAVEPPPAPPVPAPPVSSAPPPADPAPAPPVSSAPPAPPPPPRLVWPPPRDPEPPVPPPPPAPFAPPPPPPRPAAPPLPPVPPAPALPSGPSRPRVVVTRVSGFRPPLKPAVAVIAGVVLVVLVALALSGGGGDDGDRGAEPSRDVATPPTSTPPPAAGGAPTAGAKGPAQAAEIKPATLEFRAPIARLSRPLNVTVSNAGGAPITIGKVRVDGMDRSDFVATDGCTTMVLPRGRSCKVVISFVPAAPRPGGAGRPRTATLVFADDGGGGRQTVSLTGTVVKP